MSAPFDTHAVVQQLEQLGFPTPQAEGLTTILTQVFAHQDFATRADIAMVRTDIATEIARVRADLAEVRHGLELKIAGLATSLETLRGEVFSEIKPLKWGMALVAGGVLSLVVKAFVHP